MKLLYKVYKSVEVILGNKKKLEFADDQVVKSIDKNIEEEIIEAEDLEELAKEKSRQILEETELQKNQLLAMAKKEAEAILEKANEESKNIYENAKREGYSNGFKSGKEKGYQEYIQLINEATEIKKETLRTKKKLAQELEKEIIDLVIFSIGKVIDYELDHNHEILLRLIKKGLEKCTFTETLIVRTSEYDYDVVNSYKNKIFMMTEGIDEIQIKSDAALSRGSVVIETLSGKIDASINTQLDQIQTLFKELLKGEGSYD